MIIHTDAIAYTQQLRDALNASTSGVVLQRVNRKGSRSRARAFDVVLESDGTPDQHGASRRHRRNVGTARNVDRFAVGYAASWADWGHFLARVFELDHDAIAGPYRGRKDFHLQTRGAFLADDASPVGETVDVFTAELARRETVGA